MKIEIDLLKCKNNQITPNQYTILFLMYHKRFDVIKKLFGKVYVMEQMALLRSLSFFLSDDTVAFDKTILSNSKVCKLLGIREDEIRFIEFYNVYPARVGTRVLRAANVDTVQGRKHEKKYLSMIKSKQAHEEAIAATSAFVEKKRRMNDMKFLQHIETVINNAMWENWVSFIGEETKADWNTNTI